MEIKNKVAHLKGLMEGMEFDVSTKEGKIINAIVEILDDMADELELIYDDVDSLYEYEDEDDYYDECFDCEAENCDGCEFAEEDAE